MKRKALSLVFILSLIGCQQNIKEIRVKEVIDGDTIVLNNGKVLRYIGIDAPEIKRYIGGDFIYDPQPFALEAKEFNRSLVEGKKIKIEFDIQKIDNYGRLLGYCFVSTDRQDTFINAKLLEEGFASLHTKPPNVKYTDLFVSLQRKAREKEKGIWKSKFLLSSDEAHKYIGQLKSVEGKVLNISESKKALHLNFGKDWKKDFTVIIFKRDLSNFTHQGIFPSKDYKNKFLRVTGLIKEYNGPAITVFHPSSIEIIE